jgi:hypothetical protein
MNSLEKVGEDGFVCTEAGFGSDIGMTASAENDPDTDGLYPCLRAISISIANGVSLWPDRRRKVHEHQVPGFRAGAELCGDCVHNSVLKDAWRRPTCYTRRSAGKRIQGGEPGASRGMYGIL